MKDKTIRILILEDDLETLSVLMKNLYVLEEALSYMSLAVTVFSAAAESPVKGFCRLARLICLLDNTRYRMKPAESSRSRARDSAAAKQHLWSFINRVCSEQEVY